MMERDKDSEAVDALFAAGRAAEPASDDFMARLISDADAATAQQAYSAPKISSVAQRPFWQAWLPASGLTAATLAGIWIGVALPQSDLGADLLSNFGTAESNFEDFVPAFGIATLYEDEG